MNQMDLGGSPSLKVTKQERLLNIVEKCHADSLLAGRISGWDYDMTFVIIATQMVKERIQGMEQSDPEAEKLVSSVEMVNFHMFGSDGHEPEDFSVYAKEVVLPLHQAYLRHQSIQAMYPDADTMFRNIINQWVSKNY